MRTRNARVRNERTRFTHTHTYAHAHTRNAHTRWAESPLTTATEGCYDGYIAVEAALPHAAHAHTHTRTHTHTHAMFIHVPMHQATATLDELATLDLEELRGTINALHLALEEYGDELIELRHSLD